MALKGNLRDFSLVQLLNLINLAKKTGALVIETGTQNARLFFNGGKLTCAVSGNVSTPLIRMMARVRLIPNSLAASLGERYRNLDDKEAGILLINSGYLSQEQIFSGVGAFYYDLIRELYSWREGDFRFIIGESSPQDIIPVRVDLENILIEGSRQQDELEDLYNEIPSLELTLKFAERPGVDIHNIHLNAEEWRVASFVNPKNTIQQIAVAAKLNEFQIRKVVYDLLQTGLVELVRPIHTAVPAIGKPWPLRNPLEQKSLVNRVIDRIKSL